MIVFAITSKMFHQCGGGRLDNVNYNLNHIKVSHLLQYTNKIMSLVAGLNMILSTRRFSLTCSSIIAFKLK